MFPDEIAFKRQLQPNRRHAAAFIRFGLVVIALSTICLVVRAADDNPAAAKPGDQFLISGRVLGPDGTPFAGAKLYATIQSAESRPLRLKDPNRKLFEVEEVKGKPQQLRYVDPKAIALLKRFGMGPVVAADDPRLSGPEFQRVYMALIADLYEPRPALPLAPAVRATSLADGTFRFAIPKAELQAPFEQDVSVIAVADGMGPAWNVSKQPGALDAVELRLVNDLPIEGRIVDTKGKPVAGATVKLGSIMAHPDGKVDFWVETVESFPTRKFNRLLPEALSCQFPGHRLQLFPDEVTTDAEGRFKITGIGAQRVVFSLEVSAAGIGSDKFSVMTTPAAGVVPHWAGGKLPAEYRTYGAKFEHAVQPVQPVVGTVRDGATGKGLPNVQVAALEPVYVDTLTDAEGKYQLIGLSQGDEHRVYVWPWNNRRSRQPYLTLKKYVKGNNQGQPVTANFDLIRGVVLRGKLTDKRTGKPVAKAEIFYAAFKDNPRVATLYFPGNPLFPARKGVFPIRYDAPIMQQTQGQTDDQGSFDMIVLPGRGVLAAVPAEGRYQPPQWEALQKDPKLLEQTVPDLSRGWEFSAFKSIDVPERAEEIEADIQVESQP
jgi:hypothetical protein